MSMRPSYARFYASKWRSGTLMLTLEEEGLYIRVSAFQMECGQPIPLDWKEGARLLCVQPLKYRKTVDALLAKGKLISTPNGLVCERAMLEFRRASKSVEGRNSDPQTNPDTYPDTNPVSTGVEAKNDQQNQSEIRNRREEEEKKEESNNRASVEQDAARDELASLNGTAGLIITDVISWVHGADERMARKWLTTTKRTFGDEITLRAYHKLRTDIAAGAVIAHPLATFAKIAVRMQDEAKSKSVQTHADPPMSAYAQARAKIIAEGSALQ